jgi:hypothetical protein
MVILQKRGSKVSDFDAKITCRIVNRRQRINRAKIDVIDALIGATKEYDLTTVEVMLVYAELLCDDLKQEWVGAAKKMPSSEERNQNE